MAPPPLALFLGNQLLFAVDRNYPKQQRFKVRQHTVEVVTDVITRLAAPPDEWMRDVPDAIQSALDVYSGYVMFDAWIANQDRHHENWGALWDGKDMRLAPTFDHGAALARNLLDSEREERMATKDHNRTVAAFAERGRSAFYRSAHDSRPLELRELFLAVAAQVPNAAMAWREQLRNVNREALCGILDRVPAERMSEACKRFTLELLITNQKRLLQ
jgi:hypothetical protein